VNESTKRRGLGVKERVAVHLPGDAVDKVAAAVLNDGVTGM